MPKGSPAHMQARREQILQATCKCFVRKGIYETTIHEICQEAALSPGAVYRYFESKGEMIEAIAELGRANTRKYFESIPARGSATDCLMQLITAAVNFLETGAGLESTRLNLRFWSEGLHSPTIRQLLVEGVRHACEPFAEQVRRGQQAGSINQHLDDKSTARGLIAMHAGLSVFKALDPQLDLNNCLAVVEALLNGTFLADNRCKGTPPDAHDNRRACE